mgnify:CR=1 FL=1
MTMTETGTSLWPIELHPSDHPVAAERRAEYPTP